jgi:hypothetical protein
MNVLDYAMSSVLISAEVIADSFLDKAKEIFGQIGDTFKGLSESFVESVNQAKNGVTDLTQGLTGIILIPVFLCLMTLGIPILAMGWLIAFVLTAIAHTASIPLAYLWCLYQKLKEVISPQIKSIDYFPEVEVDLEPEPLVVITPPLALLAGLAAGMEAEPGSISYDWSPSYLLYTVDEVHEAHVEAIDIEAFRWGLEQQFYSPKPRQTWKEYILQGLALLKYPSLEEPLILVYPQCAINLDVQIEVVQLPAVRETVTPFPTPTTSHSGEVGCSFPVEVSIAPELKFPPKPDIRALKRMKEPKLVEFCREINRIKKGSITGHTRPGLSKTALISKIELFYAKNKNKAANS